jgi:ribosome maturation protein Sdo1
MEINYYKAPSQKIFEDIKKNAVKIWQTYDNKFGYVDEKVNRIKDLKNISDNAWTIVAMFDGYNQQRLLEMVEPKTRKAIMDILMANLG